MAKLIKKSKCEFEAGIIVIDDEQVGIPAVVYLQLEKLETMVQQYRYLAAQKPACEGPSLEGFERKSTLVSERPYIEAPKTPVTDRRVAEAMEFMAEADAVANAADVNEAIDNFGALVDWCAADKFVEGDCYKKLDLYELGNPLELKADDIAVILTEIVESPITIEA